MNCTNCHVELPTNAQFCPECGTEVTMMTFPKNDPLSDPTSDELGEDNSDAGVFSRLIELDFASEIHDLTEDFEERTWIFSEIDAWLRTPSEPFFILIGDAGIGKSAVAARLTQIRQDIAAFHFCIAGRGETIIPGTVMRSLAAQLGQNLQGYGEALANTIDPSYVSVNVKIQVGTLNGGQITGVVIENLSVADPKQEIESLIRAPLSAMKPPASPMLIVLDSLDEALTHTGKENLVTLLAGLDNLPGWVRIILTSRPNDDIMSYFASVPKHVVSAESQLNRKDLRRYVQKRVARPSLMVRIQAGSRPVDPEALIKQIAGADDEPGFANGNFLYTKFLLNDIENGTQSLDDLMALPKSLDEIYTKFLVRLAPEWAVQYQPLLAVLAIAREPLTQEQLELFGDQAARLIGKRMSATLVNLALRVLVQFLTSRGASGQERYSLFHQSLRDFLSDRSRSKGFACPPQNGNAAIAASYLTETALPWSHCDAYGLRHLPFHLAGARQYQDLQALLIDFNWLQAKLNGTDIKAVVSDYDLFLAGEGTRDPIHRIQSSLRRSAQILSGDRNQLAAQILARLINSKDRYIQQLLAGASDYRGTPWLRPMTASLASERSFRWLKPAQGESLDPVAFSPNGQWAAYIAINSGNISFWDIRKWQFVGPRTKTLRGFSYALAISDDARWCFYSDSIGGVQRLDVLGEEHWEGRVHEDGSIVFFLATSSNGQRALSACSRERLVAWDIPAGHNEIVSEHSMITALWLDAEGKSGTVAYSDGSIDWINLWPARRKTLFKVNDEPAVLTVSPDHILVAAATKNGQVEVRAVASADQPIFIFSTAEKPTAIALSRDHRYLVVGTEKGTLEIWDTDSKKQSALYKDAHTYSVIGISFSPNDDRVLSADYHQIKEWALTSPKEDEKISSLPRAVGKVKVATDGLHAVTVLEDGSLGLWDISTGTLETSLRAPSGPAFGDRQIGPAKELKLAAHAGRILAWNEKLLCIWDLEQPASTRSLPGKSIHDADITQDGKHIAFVNGQNISLWTPDEGKSIARVIYDLDPPGYVTIAPDGQSFFSSGGARYVYQWPLVLSPGQTLPETFLLRDFLRYITPNMAFNFWKPASRDKPARMAFAGPDEAIVSTGDGSLFTLSLEPRMLRIGKDEPEEFTGSHIAIIDRLFITSDRLFAVSSSVNNQVMKWHLSTRECIAKFDIHPGSVEQVSDTGQRALLVTPEGALKVVSLSDGSLVAAFQADKNIDSCAGDAALNWIAACDKSGRMHFLHLEENA